jgi:hypothetical protein
MKTSSRGAIWEEIFARIMALVNKNLAGSLEGVLAHLSREPAG